MNCNFILRLYVICVRWNQIFWISEIVSVRHLWYSFEVRTVYNNCKFDNMHFHVYRYLFIFLGFLLTTKPLNDSILIFFSSLCLNECFLCLHLIIIYYYDCHIAFNAMFEFSRCETYRKWLLHHLILPLSLHIFILRH